MPLQLRALSVLAEDVGSVSSTYVVPSKYLNSSSRGSVPLSCPQRHRALTGCTDIHAIQTHIQVNRGESELSLRYPYFDCRCKGHWESNLSSLEEQSALNCRAISLASVMSFVKSSPSMAFCHLHGLGPGTLVRG